MEFQPTPPAGAETITVLLTPLPVIVFQPTPPAGAETEPAAPLADTDIFQPTPPAGAETHAAAVFRLRNTISTHSARGGGDEASAYGPAECFDFNPLRPRGRRRLGAMYNFRTGGYFNPLRPRGRRPDQQGPHRAAYEFQPTPPAGAETRSWSAEKVVILNFNPLRPRGRRPRP